MTWEQVVSVTALVLAVIAVVVGLILLRKIAERGQRVPGLVSEPTEDDGASPEPSGPPAFVINPVKTSDPDAVRRLVIEACAELGLPDPLLYETTATDPGLGQARDALARGASVVVAAGGDGTVRAVGTALAGSRVPMGLLPLGTGNLLARNLDLPVDGTRALIQTALTGADHPIDLGWIRPQRLRPVEEETLEGGPGPDPDAEVQPAGAADKRPPDTLAEQDEHLFLVMGGIGFDAAMVAGADEELKARVGWLAYFVAGVRHLHGRKIRLSMQIGTAAPQYLRLRSLLFANCGRLPGGMVLLPDAEINDGWLDVAAIDTRGGLLGWASLFGKVILQGIGVRRQLPASPGSIDFWRGKDIVVRCDRPEPLQVDGDLIGEAVGVKVRVEPGGLLVRTRT